MLKQSQDKVQDQIKQPDHLFFLLQSVTMTPNYAAAAGGDENTPSTFICVFIYLSLLTSCLVLHAQLHVQDTN